MAAALTSLGGKTQEQRIPLSLYTLSNPISASSVVKVERGDVWIRLSGDPAFRQLTSIRLVKEAALSPDERLVAYVVDTPGDSVEGGSGTVAATAIWLIRADGSDGRRLVRGHDGLDDHIGDFRTLRFSPDDKLLYFSSEAAAVTDAVHVVTIDSVQESLVYLGQLQDVVPSGQYAGDLIVGQHHYLGERPGSYDVGGLFTPACQLIMELAVDSEGTGYDSVEAFYDRFVPSRTPQESAHDQRPGSLMRSSRGDSRWRIRSPFSGGQR